MKKIITALLLLAAFQSVDAQTEIKTDTLPTYKKYPTIPVFTIMTAPDSLKFSKDDLKKKKPVMIMIFSPDCSHCKNATEDLIKHMDLFQAKDAQVVMVSHLDFSNIKKFYEDYKIAGYSNITMGRDGTYTLGAFYKIKSFPSIFVYDAKGNFVKSFEGDVKMSEIAESL